MRTFKTLLPFFILMALSGWRVHYYLHRDITTAVSSGVALGVNIGIAFCMFLHLRVYAKAKAVIAALHQERGEDFGEPMEYKQ